MLANKLMSALSGGAEDKLYVDDVFSAYTYTDNASIQTITNGIDLAGKGGLVWTKQRKNSTNHLLLDTVRGGNNALRTDGATANLDVTPGITFGSSGYTIDQGQGYLQVNGNSSISWTFRKAPKFFDVVTYTGNGASSRAIAHSLGQEVGMVMTKATSTTDDWNTYHRSATGDLALNTSAAQTGSKALVNSATTSTFIVSGAANTNAVTYAAYLFAHDPSADGIIQCGSFTTDASGTATVNLGWEPQYILFKPTATDGDWMTSDAMRGMSLTDAQTLSPNISGAETSQSTYYWTKPNATGFNINAGVFGQTCIYLAIRRPNKPPTTGTEVYNAVTRMGTSSVPWKASGAGFPPDMSIMSGRNSAALADYQHSVIDRLRRATEHIQTINTSGEGGGWGEGHVHNMDGYDGIYSADYAYFNTSASYVDFHFRRAPGFFDVVCYTGTGAARTVPHSLGVAPELMIVKSRSVGEGWYVYHAALGSGGVVQLNNDESAYTGQLFWNSTQPTASAFSVDGMSGVGNNGATFVWYGFASLPGISKVGSYTGNGTTQTINCGFTTGARFILIKRTNSTGDWYIWDTARGIVSANDPHLSLNTAAEVTTDDSVDPNVSGFIANQVAETNINVSGGQYIFLAIA